MRRMPLAQPPCPPISHRTHGAQWTLLYSCGCLIAVSVYFGVCAGRRNLCVNRIHRISHKCHCMYRSRSSLRVVFFSPFFSFCFVFSIIFFLSFHFNFCCVKIRIWICAIVSCRCHCLVALVSLIKPVSSARRSFFFFGCCRSFPCCVLVRAPHRPQIFLAKSNVGTHVKCILQETLYATGFWTMSHAISTADQLHKDIKCKRNYSDIRSRIVCASLPKSQCAYCTRLMVIIIVVVDVVVGGHKENNQILFSDNPKKTSHKIRRVAERERRFPL